ncbi:MAG: flagellar biosynthesis anti-sigma factor FlgM [Candidatus Hydrogenedentota bacterium]
MGGVEGIGGSHQGIPPDRSYNQRPQNASTDGPKAPQDGVDLSPQAQAAAHTTRLLEIARNQPDIRADRVAVARENIEAGLYQRRDVVAVVAERVGKALS